ncbi:MAG: hypothetical protein JWO07_642 [Candidatus Saccharibacteria bacterium]|nr:hypothetical protein [Candidatus Saccharibacteria bacterium]
MDAKELTTQYLLEANVMQIATIHEAMPKVVSVYCVATEDLSVIYWMSEPRRRHSHDIEIDFRAAGAIAVKLDQPVIGLQFTGYASVVINDKELEDVIKRYNKKHQNIAEGLFERIKAGTNKHLIYKIALETLELFDGVNFVDGDPIAISLE